MVSPPPRKKRNARRPLQYFLSPQQLQMPQFTAPHPRYDRNDSWGHTLESIDASSVFRFFLQNPNCLSLHPNNYSLIQDFKSCYDYGATIISLPETKTNWDSPDLRGCLHTILKNIWGSSAFYTSKSSEPFTSTQQPGGTLTTICSNWTSRLVQRGEE